MSFESGRYTAPQAPSTAEGWTLERLTQPSRLYGANGIRTGADGRIYIAQVAGSQVSALDVDSGAIEVISPIGGNVVGPDDLVFDEAGNLYCTEITEDRVSMLKPNGEYKVLLGDVQVANPITYHQGRLIAGELRMGGRIVEIDRNGGAPRVIYEGVPMANAFEVGPDGKLYFPAQAANEIWRIDLEGGEPEVVAKDLGVPDSVKFHPDGYIVSTQVHSGQVLKIDPRTGSKEVLADLAPGLDNVAFVGKRIFISSIPGTIYEITGPGAFRNVLAPGLLNPLGVTADPDGTLFVADGSFLYSLRPGEPLEIAAMLFSAGYPGYIRGLRSTASGELTVTTSLGSVARYRPSAGECDFIAHGFDRLYGVAPGADGAIAVAEAGTGRVLSLKNGNIEELATGLNEPMGVAIAPDGSVLVAESQGGRVAKVGGGRTETLVDGLQEPQGLFVQGQKLYITDVLAKEVIEYDFSSGDHRAIGTNLPIGAPPGVTPKFLGSVGELAGPMGPYCDVTAGADGTIYFSGDGEGSVLALRRR